MVVGAHYPTDVLCGWLLGLIVVLLVPWLRRKIRNRWLFYAVLLLSALPGFFYCTSSDYYTAFGMLVGFILAEPFEEKFVRFENTHNVLRCILRTLGGAAHLLRAEHAAEAALPQGAAGRRGSHRPPDPRLRYAVVIFVDIGVYPLLFKLTGKLWEK